MELLTSQVLVTSKSSRNINKVYGFGVEVGAWAGEVPSKSVLRSTKETRLATIKHDIITRSYNEH